MPACPHAQSVDCTKGSKQTQVGGPNLPGQQGDTRSESIDRVEPHRLQLWAPASCLTLVERHHKTGQLSAACVSMQKPYAYEALHTVLALSQCQLLFVLAVALLSKVTEREGANILWKSKTLPPSPPAATIPSTTRLHGEVGVTFPGHQVAAPPWRYQDHSLQGREHLGTE